MPNLEVWVEFIQSIAPALVSIIGVISTLVVTIHKVKCHCNDVKKESQRAEVASTNMEKRLSDLIYENQKVEKQLKEIQDKLNHVHRGV